MPSDIPTGKRRDAVYNGLKASLGIIESVLKISPVPGLEGIITAVKSIMDTVEGAKHNKQACYDICVKINKLIDVVHTELKERDDTETDKATRARISSLESSLEDISHKLSDLAQENAFRRAINRVADADLITDLNSQVDECINNFMIGTQLSTGMDVKYLRDEAIRARITEGLDTGGWRSDRRCLPGTRTRYINRIWEWIRSSEGPALCWLHGVAGSGKSSISHELAASLHTKRLPYSCFFFRHDDGSLASSAVRLLAYGLSFVSGLHELVIRAMEQSNDTRVNPTMEEQFASLIVGPLTEFATISPLTTVVLVIDGVDECPTDIRPSFLAAIQSGAPRLPATVKIFLASRPRGDMRSYLEALGPLEVSVAVGAGTDDGDIERFLQHELERISKVSKVDQTWPASQIKKDAGALALKAGGLFQWARLLSSLLDNRLRPQEVVSRILAVKTTSTLEVNLDVLYTEALEIALPSAAVDKDLYTLYRKIVGTVVAAKQPLTVNALCMLLKADDDGAKGAIQTLLENLGCVLVLHRIRAGAVLIRIGHPSFYDYVTSRERCPANWFIDPDKSTVLLGSRCFALMARFLRRDICRSGCPSVANRDVPFGTLYKFITTGLRYACCFAFTHIAGDRGNLQKLETFLMEKLLEWLEAMSLLRLLDTAVELMQNVLEEVNQRCISPSSIEMLHDAIRFVGRFGSILDQSAVHAYFSALPFTPQGTMLYRVYSERYRDIPRVTLGYPESWPDELCTVGNLGGSARTPRLLAFSADSSRFGLSTPTHLVAASPFSGVQLRKYRLFGGRRKSTVVGKSPVAEMPIALGCHTAFLASVTSGLLLRIADRRSLTEVQLSLPPNSTDKLPMPHSPEVTCAAFDRTVNTLCVGCRNGRIQLWRLRHLAWEPEKDGFPYSHSSAVIHISAASDLLASVSQRELKIGPCGHSKHGDLSRKTVTLTPRWLTEARDIRLSFAASSAVAWACAISVRSGTADDHSIYVVTSADQKGRKVFSSNCPSYPLYTLSMDASVVTIVCGEILRRISTVSYNLLENRSLTGIDSTNLDRFPAISPDGRLLAICDGEVVHIWDLVQPLLKSLDHKPRIKAEGVIMTDKCYIVKGGKQKWLARVHDDGTSQDITQLREYEIEQLAVSADGSRLAALSFQQGKTRHGFLEIVDLNSKKRSNTAWPVALHDSFIDWQIRSMEFSTTGKHIAVIFFLAEATHVCICDLEDGSLRWTQLAGKMIPLAARSLRGEELIVVRTRDVWKVDLKTGEGIRKELYSRDPYKMATLYAKFSSAETAGGAALLEMASRLWNKPPRHTIWDADTAVALPAEEAKTGCTVAHLEVQYKNSLGHWVLSNAGQRVCCIPEEYCAKWGVGAQSSISHDRLALLTGDGTVLIVDFRPMMGFLNRASSLTVSWT